MSQWSIWHWTIFLFSLTVFVAPLWRIVSRAGFNGAMSLLVFVPGVNIVLLWLFAFSKWPSESRNS
jgi:hypothetical protein